MCIDSNLQDIIRSTALLLLFGILGLFVLIVAAHLVVLISVVADHCFGQGLLAGSMATAILSLLALSPIALFMAYRIVFVEFSMEDGKRFVRPG